MIVYEQITFFMKKLFYNCFWIEKTIFGSKKTGTGTGSNRNQTVPEPTETEPNRWIPAICDTGSKGRKIF